MNSATTASSLWLVLGTWLVATLWARDQIASRVAAGSGSRGTGRGTSRRPAHRPAHRPVTRAPWFGLLVWIAVSLASIGVTRVGVVPGLLVGTIGGLAFGWVAALRVDAMRVKIRSRRKRRRPSGDGGLPSEQYPAAPVEPNDRAPEP